MRIFRFCFYALALLLGIIMGFCDNPTYPLPEPIPERTSNPIESVIDQVKPVASQFPDGKKLFKNNCAACHNRNMRDDMTGPALAGVRKRWEGREDLLYSWISNSRQLWDSGDPYITQLVKDWKKSPMPAFPNLSTADIDQILGYIDEVGGK